MPYRFSPPSFQTGESLSSRMDATARRLFGHFRPHRRGYTVRKVDGVYVQSTETYTDDLLAADVVYQGGHSYEVSDEEAAALTSAGYGSGLEEL